MRVIECNRCGEVVSAEDDSELVDRLARHMGDEHGGDASRAELADFVRDEAYDAMDS